MDGRAECTEQQKMLGELTEALGDAEISYSNLKLAIQESECADKYLKQVYLEKCQAEDRAWTSEQEAKALSAYLWNERSMVPAG